MNPDQTISLQTVNGWAVLPSSLRHSDQSPRFHLHLCASLPVSMEVLTMNVACMGGAMFR
jgi:hypothetical protein